MLIPVHRSCTLSEVVIYQSFCIPAADDALNIRNGGIISAKCLSIIECVAQFLGVV